MRDSREAYAVSSNPISIAVNNRNYGEIKRGQFLKAKLQNGNEKALVSINGESEQIDMDGRTRYFNVIHQSEKVILLVLTGVVIWFGESGLNLWLKSKTRSSDD